MPTTSLSSGTELARLVERQIRNWEIAKTQHPGDEAKQNDVHPFVCIARQVGAGGGEIARNLGERIGWPVFDRELLQAMASDDTSRRRLYEQLDERDIGWLEQMLGWVLEARFTSDDYFSRLTRVILAIARGGPAVFLGRAADLILPRSHGLRIQIVAPLERRLQRLSERVHQPRDVAEKELSRLEHDRAGFVKSHFGREAMDPLRFDLVLNTETWSHEACIGIILTALRLRGVAIHASA